MKKLLIPISIMTALLWSCNLSEPDIITKKQVFDYTKVTGEFVADLSLTGGATATDRQHIRIYNTANDKDSLWVEDKDFWVSQVKVKWDGETSFSVTGGKNILTPGETADITGQVFPDQDSVQITWRYPQNTGDPNDDYVVTAHGRLYNGITN